MVGEETIGEVVTGGLMAHAIDPQTHEQTHGRDHHASGRCLNCGAFLSTRYCGQCGQSAHIHHNVMAFLHDLMHGILHFEGKLWRTMPLLIARPGELTRRYVDGERARFFSPLALFLFSVFLTFGIFHALGGQLSPSALGVEAVTSQSAQARVAVERDLAAAIRTRDAARARGQNVAEQDAEIARLRQIKDVLESDGASWINSTHSDLPPVEAILSKARENPALVFYKMQSNAYKYAWALIPLSAPFLWLLYPFSRRFGLYDHLVFVTYSLAFMLMLAAALRLAAWAGLSAGVWATAALVVPPIHMYAQLRGCYRSSRIGSILRTSMIALYAALLLIVFAVWLLALGAGE